LRDNDAPNFVPYEPRVPFASGDGWVTVGLKRTFVDLRFPNACCWCLAETEDFVCLDTSTTYDGRIPLCARCRAYWRKRRRLVLALHLGFVATCALILLIVTWPPILGFTILIALMTPMITIITYGFLKDA
jgi:hypothetical protein